MKRWWLDELAHAGPEHLEAEYVRGYDAKAQVDPSPDVEVLGELGLGPASNVIELGAGTGTFSLAVAPLCAHVTAVDVSPAMVAALQAKVAEAGRSNITVVESGFLSYEHAGPPADVVYTRNALHQLPDFWKVVALDRIATLLRPGGILRLRDLVYDFEPAETDERIEAWMAGAVADPAVGWTADELAEHVRTEFSTFRWLFEVMLERTGFDILDRSFDRGAYAAYTCRRL